MRGSWDGMKGRVMMLCTAAVGGAAVTSLVGGSSAKSYWRSPAGRCWRGQRGAEKGLSLLQ